MWQRVKTMSGKWHSSTMEGGASYMWRRFVAPFNEDTISNGEGPPSPKGFYFLHGNQFFLVILMHIEGQLSQEFFFVWHVEHHICYIIHTNFELIAHLSHLEGFVKNVDDNIFNVYWHWVIYFSIFWCCIIS